VPPSEFLRLAAHPLRWQLLAELARCDRQVYELTALLGQPQSLVSYHLGLLRKAELVTARRSTADGRDTYYVVDLDRVGDGLADAGATLHPGLRLNPPPPPAPCGNLLFLCTGNSSRSQMAEALVRRATAGAVHARSAGSRPKPVHPTAIAVMAERGIDLSGARSKHLSQFTARRFDLVITLCDRVREVCPEFPGHPEPVHWSIPDPAADPAGYPAFQRTAAELETRIRYLLHRL
jgi:ArsR family transcriptional regulator, arsenate/arsenite/antimonite-responsive transcriptional repressor / arsenate reductase (thioredoxin)